MWELIQLKDIYIYILNIVDVIDFIAVGGVVDVAI
jgi:hypothetical protein